jgi:2'-5' RNA ligase
MFNVQDNMRIFVAINFTEGEKQRLFDASQPLRDAGFPVRWVALENVHLTLKFLGEVVEARLGEITTAVEEAAGGTGRFELAMVDFGAFPSLRRPRVVWAGTELNDQLKGLQARVEGNLDRLGFPREERTFRAHLTLGRARKGAGAADFAGFDSVVKDLSYGDTFQVRSVDVMRSRLMPGGAIYDALSRAELEVGGGGSV